MFGLFKSKTGKAATAKPSWTARIERRTARWAQKRHAQGKTDPIPHKITGRRTYIIPTRFGAVFAFAVFLMLLGSMNYSNSLAFILTFMLIATGFVAMHLTNFNLSGIEAEPAYAEAVFAGDTAILKVGLRHNRELKPQVMVSNSQLQNNSRYRLDVEQTEHYASLMLPTEKRGYISLDHYVLATRFPMNLFHAWTVVFQPVSCLVYPRPADQIPDIYGDHDNEESLKTTQRLGQDDFAGLREYQWQDSPQHIAWKTYAARDELLVKTFHETQAKTLWFDFDELDSMDTEQRLSVLCRLILDADKARQNYGLRLGAREIPPAHGDKHRHECLRALALYESDVKRYD